MRNKLLLLTLLLGFIAGKSFGQNYPLSSYTSGTTITTCKGTFTPAGAYQACTGYNNNTNKTITFCSGTGSPIRISFIDWDLESGYDYVRVYDGTSTAGTLLGTINGTSDIYTSGALAFTSTGTCLTVQFTSDGSVTGCGWDAIIGCAPQNCGSNLPANDFCGSAPQICDLNGYCGNTSGWYTRDNGQIDNAVGSGLFCGSIENNSWLTFVASATTATFTVNSFNCAVSGSGIQAEVFSTSNCSSFTSKSNCVSQSSASGSFTLTATGLTVGTRYYVMIDGYAGNICDYTVTANTGVQVLSFVTSASNNQICEGSTATIKIRGASAGSTFSWSANPPGSIVGSTTDSVITVNPTVTTTYSVVVTQPNGCLTQTETFTLIVNPKKTARLDTTICQGQSVTICGQAYNASGTYTKVCTTSKGCDSTVTLNLNVTTPVTPTFNTFGPYCVGATPGTLPTTSNNGITGTWNPATISTSAPSTTTYTFTPTAGQCATTATISVTVNANTTPTFNTFGPYCVGATPGTLPTTSNNGITGTWNPATISTASQGTTTYTFTPTAGQCATTATISVIVNSNITPTFNAFGPYCVGATPGTLPTTSNNGITGIWNPATISTASQGTTTYTFTPTAGQCATTATISVTISTNIVPTFNAFGPYCVRATPGTLPTTSNNGITGTWNPATISTANQGTTTYTFTPTAGQCATSATVSVTVNPNITPTFNGFSPYCVGATPGTLPTTSNNGITGTWNPATISTASQGTATYTFTPTAGQCATTATISVTVNPNITPTFNAFGPYCVGATPGTLPTTSNNGITGTWNPSTITTAASGTTVFTFTPTAGQCATTATLSVTVNQNITPTFNAFGPYCTGATPGTLPTTSNNGITGTWNPATISTASQGTTTYTFTPTAGQCATTATLTVTVNTNITPTFNAFGPYCVGATPGTLPTTSNNGIPGTWNPATISTASQGTTTYTFTPSAGQCGTTASISVTVNANITPTFNGFGPYCVGATPGTLPTTSNNGITGTWNPATISTTTAGNTIYTFTPTAGQCATTKTLTVTVNANITPTFNAFGPYCAGATPGNLPTTSNNGITGTWNPATISTSTAGAGIYTFTPTAGQCATTATLTVTVKPTKITNITRTICQGSGVTIGNQIFTTTGNYSVTLSTSLGCDSIVNLDLTVNPTLRTVLNDTICQGDSVTVGTQHFYTGGTFSVTLQSAQSCDSIVTLNLFVNPKKTLNLAQVICEGDSIVIGTRVFKVQGDFAITLQTSKGCDSIVNLNLTVLDTSVNTFVTTICAGDSVTVGDQTFKDPGIYAIRLQSTRGCDSTVILDLRIKPIQTTNLAKTICQGESFGVGNQSFSSTGIYTVKLQSSQSCDSIVILDLTVNPITRSERFEIICEGDSIVIGGLAFDTSGNYSITLQNAYGCDSIINLNLTVNPAPVTSYAKTICNGQAEIVGNQVFTESGNYTINLQTASSCDSIVKLQLTVIEPVSTELSRRVCEGEAISVGDSIYTQTGEYTNILTAASGCDSIVHLSLTVDPKISVSINPVICEGDSLVVGNQVFKVEGAYSVVLPSATGCDSTVNIDLTVTSTTRTSISRSICSGDTYTVGQQSFNETGEYTVRLQSATGCDSIVLLNLLVNSLPNIDAVADKPAVNVDEQVQLNVTTTENLTYNWSPADVLNNPNIQNPTAVLTQSTWFTVTATNGQTGCSFTDSVYVELNELACSKENVFIPNAFTPNGDGINDVFIPRSNILKSMKLVIVDRWGNKVFESNDINIGWDGTYKGQPATVDSYGYYFVGECTQGEKITIKGNVSLLR